MKLRALCAVLLAAFAAARRSSLDQRNLAQAETNEMQALVNYAKSLVSYDHAIGNTLARNNIQFDKQLPPPKSVP
jgi:hypothetical protein